MQVRILSVGKIKEDYLRAGIAEYKKRIGRYAQVEILSVADEKTPQEASAALEEQIKRVEGERLLKLIREKDYCIALCIDGWAPDSVGLSKRMQELMISGESSLTFVIGGSLGLSKEVLGRCQEKLSFSKLTFPHQLMQMILLEQIYRSFKIMNHEPYHK